MERVDTFVIDKTGTLTEGKPKVVAIVAHGGSDEAEVLRHAASVERASEHPLAHAILARSAAAWPATGRGAEFRIAGGQRGLGEIDGRTVMLGNAMLMRERGVDIDASEEAARAQRETGATVIHVAVNGAAIGVIAHCRSGQGRRSRGTGCIAQRRAAHHHADRRP